MYQKVLSSFNFVEMEKKIMGFWKEEDIFRKSIRNREGKPTFTFYDGPPTANGKPHIGHVLTRAIKDIIPRYKTMKGFKVFRKAGWDTHGLPVELEVEKKLGISGKPQIEEYGVERFIKQCKASVFTYAKEWEDMSERVAFWADMENPYVTYHNDYIESVWWALKTIFDKGLLYKGYKVMPYCPRCGTSLSSHEVAQGYKEIEDCTIYVKFQVKDQDQTAFLVWTTTPWTLPSNVALAINEKQSYVKVQLMNGESLILAKARLEVLTESYQIISEMMGKELLGMEYQPLYTFVQPLEKAFYVVSGDYVTMTEGTGIVHTAPAFGEDDYQVGKKYGLPLVQLVNGEGKFTKEVIPWQGLFVKEGDPYIIEDLDHRQLLYKTEAYSHTYPFCWRCDTPLLYYARDSWFIQTTAIKDKLVENNQKINWMPEHIKNGRFGNFLENVIDWGVSRERYWGTPLPLWTCECGHVHCIGSIEELKRMGRDVPENIELHKPYIDQVFLQCPKCGHLMKRVSEVIDCWFDSGAMPFAQWHYPFENKEIFEDNFPADFISEAIDQTRGWFYTLLVISTILFDQPSFKNCITLGLVLDKDGQKMSKHKGNVLSPWTVFDKQGADATRWYFYTSSFPWLPSRFYEEAVSEAQRKFMGTLWNVYGFYVLYADLDQFNPHEHCVSYEERNVMDRWILSRLHSLVKLVDHGLKEYKITESARSMNDFVEILSNWYVRRSRERFWQTGMEKDKVSAYLTLYEVLETLARLAAPFVPFLTEEIYQNLVCSIVPTAPKSVHLCDFPVYNEKWIDMSLEEQMDEVVAIVTLGRAARNRANRKIRQPLQKMLIQAKDMKPLGEELTGVIKDELNVKELEQVLDISALVVYSAKPDLTKVGPKYGKLVPKIAQALKLGAHDLIKTILETGMGELTIEGTVLHLVPEDLLIETGACEGYVLESERERTIVLDATLTPELIEEGYVREITSKIQTMRKDTGFEVTDRIVVYYYGNDRLDKIIRRNESKIADQTLTNRFIVGQEGQVTYTEWKINDEKLMMAVIR